MELNNIFLRRFDYVVREPLYFGRISIIVDYKRKAGNLASINVAVQSQPLQPYSRRLSVNKRMQKYELLDKQTLLFRIIHKG